MSRRNFQLRNHFARIVINDDDIGKSSADINADANFAILGFRFRILISIFQLLATINQIKEDFIIKNYFFIF